MAFYVFSSFYFMIFIFDDIKKNIIFCPIYARFLLRYFYRMFFNLKTIMMVSCGVFAREEFQRMKERFLRDLFEQFPLMKKSNQRMNR